MLWRLITRTLKQVERNQRQTQKEYERQQKQARKAEPVQRQQADLKMPPWMEELVSLGLATKVYHDSTQWTWNIKATPCGKCQHCLGIMWNINETYFYIQHAPHCKPEGDGLHRWSEIGH
jgi:hypothetical protein